jgi:hypothetical protein
MNIGGQHERHYVVGVHRDYTDDCERNDFVVKVVPPFKAESKEEATKILLRRIG